MPNVANPGQAPLNFGKNLNLDRTFTFQIDTRGTRGFDLDQVHVTLTGPDGIQRNLGLPERALYDFGGRRLMESEDVFPTQTAQSTRQFRSDNPDSAIGFVSPRKNGLDVFRFKLAANLRASLVPGDYQLGIAATKLGGSAESVLVPFKIVADRTPHVALSTEGATASYDYGTGRFIAQIPVLATAPANLVELQVWRSSVPSTLGERIQTLPASGLTFSSTLILQGDGQYAVIAKDETGAYFGVSFAIFTSTLVAPTLMLGATGSMTLDNVFTVADATTGVQFHTNSPGTAGSLRTAVLDLKKTAAPPEGGLSPLGGRWLVSPPQSGSGFNSYVTSPGLDEIRAKVENGGPFINLSTAAALFGGPSLEGYLETSEDPVFGQPSATRLDRQRGSRYVFTSQFNLSAPLETAYDAFAPDLPISRYYRIRQDFLPDSAGMCVSPGSSAACAEPGRGGLAVGEFQFPLIARSTAVISMMTHPDSSFPGPFNTLVGQDVVVELPGIQVQYEQVTRVGDTAASSPEDTELVPPPSHVEVAASETLSLSLADHAGGVFVTLPYHAADDLIPGWEQNLRLLAGTVAGEFWADITLEVDPVAKTVKGRIPPELGHGATLKIMRFDGVPPAAVAELGPSAVGRDFMAMTWQTSGDDGLEGEGAGDEVRYSDNAAFLSNFDLGTRLDDADSESDGDSIPAGFEGGVTIDGLAPGTEYYVGVRSFDRAGNFATTYSQAIRTGDLFRRESAELIAGFPELTISAEQPVGASPCASSPIADAVLPHQGIERVGRVYCLGPHRQGFLPPAELMMRYDPAAAANKNVPRDSLAIYERVSEDLPPHLLAAFGAVPGAYFEAFSQTASGSSNEIEAFIPFMSSTFVVAGLAPEITVSSTRTIRGTPELRLGSRDRLLALEPVAPSSPAISSALSGLTSQGLTLAGTIYHVTPDVPFFVPAGALTVRIDTRAVISGQSFDTSTFVLYQLADGALAFSAMPGQSLSQDGAAITASISSTPILAVFGRLRAPAAPPDPAESRQFNFAFNLGSAGGAPGQFGLPEDAAVDSQGNLYVADRQNYRVQKFSPDGTFLREWGSQGSGPGQFGLGPLGLSVCQAAGPDHLLAVDAVNRTISIFTPEGGFVDRFGPVLAPGVTLSQPVGAVCDAQGNVYVTDFTLNRLFKTTLSGQLLTSWGQPSHPRLSRMWHAVVDPAGVLFVAANDAVAKFGLNGEFLGVLGAGGFNQDGNVLSARGVALDSFRNLYVTGSCQTDRCVQVFRPNGQFLAKFGTPGNGPGQLNGIPPDGLAVDPRTGRVWLADTWNNRVAAFDVAIPTVDFHAPLTSFAPVGPAALDPVFSPEVQVLSPSTLIGFAATDTASPGVVPAGVAYIEYRVDGGPFIRYSTPFSPGIVFNGQNFRTLEFRSADNAGNVEPLSLVRFSVDFHAPQSAVYVDGFQATTPSGSTDAAQLTGLATTVSTITVFALDSGNPRTAGPGPVTVQVDGTPALTRPSSFTPFSFGAFSAATALELAAPLPAGSHALTWYAADAVGNAEGARTVTFEVVPPPEDPAGVFAYRRLAAFANGTVSPGADIAVDFRQNTFLLNPNSFTVYKYNPEGALAWTQTLFPMSEDPGIGVGVAFRIVSNLMQQESVLVVMGDTVYLITAGVGSSAVPSAFGGFSLGQPSDAAFDHLSNIYVSSLDQGRIFKFTSQLGILAAIGGPGPGEGEFRQGPSRLAIDRFGNIYAADAGQPRILQFNALGNHVRTLNGSFSSVSGLAADFYGNVYAAETGTRWIHVFSSTGGFIRRFAGPEGASFSGIDVHPVTGRIYAADGAGRNIAVLAPDQAPGGVADLTVSTSPEGDALLRWTATGEDGAVGTAAAYELRFASRPIANLETFLAAPSAGGLPAPKPAGQAEQFLLTGLEGATSYYFALRAFDTAGTPSGLSNVANALTPFIARSTTTVLAEPELLFTAAQPVAAVILPATSTVGAVVLGTATAQGLVTVSNIFDLGPEGAYSPPALLVIRYSTAALAAAGLSEEDVAIYHFDPVLGLTLVPGQTRDAANHSLSVFLPDIASIFGAFAIGRDHAVPVTQLAALGPSFSEDGGPLFIATRTLVSLSAVDPVVLATAAGVALTEFRVDAASAAAFVPYAGPFSLAPGAHSVEFRSADAAGNVETARTLTVVVDGSAPVFVLEPAGPAFQAAEALYLSPRSTLSVNGRDQPEGTASGLAELALAVDGATTTQAGPSVALHLAAGGHALSVSGADRVGNAAEPATSAVRVDAEPPVSALALSGPSTTTPRLGLVVSTRTLFVLSSEDPPLMGVAAGVKEIRYSLDGATATYAAPFALVIGSHVLTVAALDRVDNAEAERAYEALVDGQPPVVQISSPVAGARFVARQGVVLVAFSAADDISEVPSVSARLAQLEDRGSPRGERPAEIAVASGRSFEPLDLDDGLWELRVLAHDDVANAAEATNGQFEVVHDVLPPRTALSLEGPRVPGGPGGTPYVSSATLAVLQSLDDLVAPGDGAGLGVALQEFQAGDAAPIQAANPIPSPDAPFRSTFSLAGLADGLYPLRFSAADTLGNREAVQLSSVALDATAPRTNLAISGVTATGLAQGSFYTSASTLFSVSAQDPEAGGVASGVAETVILDNALALGSSSFTLNEGSHLLWLRSRDRVGNSEAPRSTTALVDATPPVSRYALGAPSLAGPNGLMYISTSTALTFFAEDPLSAGVSSGLERIDVSVDGGEFLVYAATLTFLEGRRTVRYRATDRVGNIEGTRALELWVDATPPQTAFVPSSALFEVPGPLGSKRYAPASFAYTFAAVDPESNGVSAGVGGTRFRTALLTGFDTAPQAQVEAFRIYQGSFSLSEGIRRVDFQTHDAVGNLELLRSATVFVDATPPTSSLALSGPQHQPAAGPLMVGPATLLSLSGQDPLVREVASGLRGLSVSVDGPPASYSGPFTLPTPDGVKNAVFLAVDNVGNAEPARGRALALDSTAPRTSLAVRGGRQAAGEEAGSFYASSDTRFALPAEDPVAGGVAAGLAETLYADGGVSLGVPPAEFSLAEGEHLLSYGSRDRVDNLEVARSTVVLIDATTPSSAFEVGLPSHTASDGALYIGTTSLVGLSAQDPALPGGRPGSGLASLEGAVDGGPFAAFASSYAFSEGVRELRARSSDRVGNTEHERALAFRVDGTSPESALEVGAPQALLPDGNVLISVRTPLGIFAQDPIVSGVASGVAERLYRTVPGAFIVAADSFTLSGLDGPVLVEFFARDKVANAGLVQSRALLLDTLPPVAGLVSPGPDGDGICRVFNGTVSVRGTVSDAYFKEYRLEAAPGQEATSGFVLVSSGTAAVSSGTLARWDTSSWSGFVTLRLSAEDLVGNGASVSLNVFVGDPGRLMVLGDAKTFDKPHGVAVDEAGRLHVADTHANRIAVFSATGAFLSSFGGTSALDLAKPKAVAVDVAANVYVADTLHHRVLKLSPQGGILLELGDVELPKNKTADRDKKFRSGSGPGQFDEPSGVAVGPDGRIVVSDTGNNRVQVFAPDGAHLLSVELPDATEPVEPDDEDDGEDPEDRRSTRSLGKPYGVAVDGADNIYVADMKGRRALKYGPAGDLLAVIGRTGSGLGEFRKPEGIAVSRDGDCLLVSDRQLHRVQRFDRAGSAVLVFGEKWKIRDGQPLPPELAFAKPAGLALDPAGRLFVADHGNDRVQSFGLPDGSETRVAGADTGGKEGGAKLSAVVSSLLAPAGVLDEDFGLRDIYVFPNPAVRSQRPTVHVAVGIADKVVVRFFDIAGTPVHETTLTDRPQVIDDGSGPKYAYEYAWDGHIPSGVYLYVVTVEKSGHAPIKRVGKLAVVR